MGVIKPALIGLFSLLLLGSLSGVAFASSENWFEIARFDATMGEGSTESFTVDHVDWRIKWSYNPTVDARVFPLRFRFNVYEVGNKLAKFYIPPSNQIAGTLNMNQTGNFYLYIDAMYAETYSITIEQNIDSIPEFPSWIISPLFLVSVLVAIVIRNKIAKQRRNENFFSKE